MNRYHPNENAIGTAGCVHNLTNKCRTCIALESRIAALAAELEQARAYAAACEQTAALNQQENVHLKLEIATERAAREQAEKEAAQYKLWFDETAKSHEATNAHLERAEHERNEHAKHRANLDRKNQELSRENERLVDYASGCQRERGTALARVKELENDLEIANQHFRARVAELEAVETALASARELLERAHRWVAGPVIRRDVEAWLTSHPAPVAAPRSESRCALSINGQHDWYCKLCMPTPVAAPERGTRDVVETAIDLTKDDKRSRWNEPGELPVTVMATSEYPSPAPCSGCASARKLLLNINECVNREDVRGVIRAWLKEHGNG